MRRRILWITFWTTVAYWLGGAFGCATAGHGPSKGVHETRPAMPAGHANLKALAAAPSTQPSTPVTDTEPSLKSDTLDRSHWGRLTVTPANGSTWHGPLYFRDCPIFDRSEVQRLNTASTTEGQFDQALSGTAVDTFGRKNLLGLFAQPVKMGADIVMLPVHAAQKPPWTIQTSR